jgi:hypothetical protein
VALHCRYFSITTLTTVGFGDVSPVTEPGRFVVVLEMLCAVTIIPFELTSISRTLAAEDEELKGASGTAEVAEAEVNAEVNAFTEAQAAAVTAATAAATAAEARATTAEARAAAAEARAAAAEEKARVMAAEVRAMAAEVRATKAEARATAAESRVAEARGSGSQDR